jgi:hypothetical protein
MAADSGRNQNESPAASWRVRPWLRCRTWVVGALRKCRRRGRVVMSAIDLTS